ncbi:NAD-dependent deacylase [Chryseobacterium salipaludis]|uniref:SIR2 family NAD-dependent protein deacylase n=1 Tax=Chryseobacterium TaxID=59732 RepID=UPI001FF26E95|nr:MULTISPECIES: NAD-dependent deacylase [Chryseobacterium]MCJ8497815.1 NAD-dependent deacylase [Chryseobacterium salipaludis]MCX3296986.1 NAD-dependent deacylase [Planobacterium sp. JC490]
MKKKLVALSGAGISAESGVRTFRDANGLWENHDINEVASPEGFARNPQLVLDFYNARRRQLLDVVPNRAHEILAELQSDFDVQIITQNVDDLHERAGSRNVLHLHGELLKARPVDRQTDIITWKKDLNLGDVDKRGKQLRPHIVWFGEMVPEMENALELVGQADILLVIGTSLNVYPAAGLVDYLTNQADLYVIDPELPARFKESDRFMTMKATEGMVRFRKMVVNSGFNV